MAEVPGQFSTERPRPRALSAHSSVPSSPAAKVGSGSCHANPPLCGLHLGSHCASLPFRYQKKHCAVFVLRDGTLLKFAAVPPALLAASVSDEKVFSKHPEMIQICSTAMGSLDGLKEVYMLAVSALFCLSLAPVVTLDLMLPGTLCIIRLASVVD